MIVLRVFVFFTVSTLIVVSASAQTAEDDAPTRAALIAREQEAKARTAAPYEPDRVERYFARIEERGIPFLSPPRGVYPAIGSIYPGGGLGWGGGYRYAVGDDGAIDAHALFSLATYKRIEATFQSPHFSRKRVQTSARVGWLDAPRVGYFGLGPDASAADHTVFRLRQSYADAALTWRPIKALEFGAGAGRESFDQRSGTGRSPSIESKFSPVTAPALGELATFTTLSGSAGLMWLDSPAYSRHGGLFRWTLERYIRDRSDASFGVSRAEIVQHVPLVRENWVISLRARTEGILGEDANAPFYLLPSLGSGSTLRAYRTGRFRDTKSVLFSGEWRWIPSPLAMDVALFVDAGNVGRHWDDILRSRFRKDIGIGVRFHAPAATALRVEVAHGDEGFHLVFTSGAAF
jgi:hypothetical protein